MELQGAAIVIAIAIVLACHFILKAKKRLGASAPNYIAGTKCAALIGEQEPLIQDAIDPYYLPLAPWAGISEVHMSRPASPVPRRLQHRSARRAAATEPPAPIASTATAVDDVAFDAGPAAGDASTARGFYAVNPADDTTAAAGKDAAAELPADADLPVMSPALASPGPVLAPARHMPAAQRQAPGPALARDSTPFPATPRPNPRGRRRISLPSPSCETPRERNPVLDAALNPAIAPNSTTNTTTAAASTATTSQAHLPLYCSKSPVSYPRLAAASPRTSGGSRLPPCPAAASKRAPTTPRKATTKTMPLAGALSPKQPPPSPRAAPPPPSPRKMALLQQQPPPPSPLKVAPHPLLSPRRPALPPPQQLQPSPRKATQQLLQPLLSARLVAVQLPETTLRRSILLTPRTPWKLVGAQQLSPWSPATRDGALLNPHARRQPRGGLSDGRRRDQTLGCRELEQDQLQAAQEETEKDAVAIEEEEMRQPPRHLQQKQKEQEEQQLHFAKPESGCEQQGRHHHQQQQLRLQRKENQRSEVQEVAEELKQQQQMQGETEEGMAGRQRQHEQQPTDGQRPGHGRQRPEQQQEHEQQQQWATKQQGRPQQGQQQHSKTEQRRIQQQWTWHFREKLQQQKAHEQPCNQERACDKQGAHPHSFPQLSQLQLRLAHDASCCTSSSNNNSSNTVNGATQLAATSPRGDNSDAQPFRDSVLAAPATPAQQQQPLASRAPALLLQRRAETIECSDSPRASVRRRAAAFESQCRTSGAASTGGGSAAGILPLSPTAPPLLSVRSARPRRALPLSPTGSGVTSPVPYRRPAHAASSPGSAADSAAAALLIASGPSCGGCSGIISGRPSSGSVFSFDSSWDCPSGCSSCGSDKSGSSTTTTIGSSNYSSSGGGGGSAASGWRSAGGSSNKCGSGNVPLVRTSSRWFTLTGGEAAATGSSGGCNGGGTSMSGGAAGMSFLAFARATQMSAAGVTSATAAGGSGGGDDAAGVVPPVTPARSLAAPLSTGKRLAKPNMPRIAGL